MLDALVIGAIVLMALSPFAGFILAILGRRNRDGE